MFYRNAQSRRKRIREPGRSFARSALDRSKTLPRPINRAHSSSLTASVKIISLEKVPAWNSQQACRGGPAKQSNGPKNRNAHDTGGRRKRQNKIRIK